MKPETPSPSADPYDFMAKGHMVVVGFEVVRRNWGEEAIQRVIENVKPEHKPALGGPVLVAKFLHKLLFLRARSPKDLIDRVPSFWKLNLNTGWVRAESR